MSPEERFERMEGIMEKQNAGIRDLIIVSRTLLTSLETVRENEREAHAALSAQIHEVSLQIQELRDAQATTDEKLNILIDTVDRIIRRDNDQMN
jgi:hypothetical protein